MILDEARTAVHEAGLALLQSLLRLTGGTATSVDESTTSSESSWSWGSLTSDQWAEQWGDEGWANFGSSAPALGLSAVLASGYASAWVWREKGSFSTPVGPANGEFYGEGSVTLLNAGAMGQVSFDPTAGLQVAGSAEAELFSLQGNTGYRNDYVDANIEGEFSAGAYADVNAQITKDGVEVGGEVLAGAKATADGQVTFGGIGITGGVEGWAGAGYAAEGEVSWDDGKFVLKAHEGLAWGLGGAASLGIVIDVNEVGRSVSALWDNLF